MTHLKTVKITDFSRCKISIKSCTRALALKFYIMLDKKIVGSRFDSDRNIHLNIAQNNAIRGFPWRTSLKGILAQHRQSNWLLKTCLWHREPQKIPQISIYPNLVLFGAVFLTKNTIYTLFWCFCALTTYSGYTSNKINKKWVWDVCLELTKVFEIQFDRFDCARKRSSEVLYEKIAIALFWAMFRWTFRSELDLELTFLLSSTV